MKTPPLTAREAKELEPLFMEAIDELRASVERAGEEIGERISKKAESLGVFYSPERSEFVSSSWMRGWNGQPARARDDKRAHAMGVKSAARFLKPSKSR